MQLLVKYLSQFLLIPLIKELCKWLVNRIKKFQKERIERKALEEANRNLNRRVREYEESSADDAFDKHP